MPFLHFHIDFHFSAPSFSITRCHYHALKDYDISRCLMMPRAYIIRSSTSASHQPHDERHRARFGCREPFFFSSQPLSSLLTTNMSFHIVTASSFSQLPRHTLPCWDSHAWSHFLLTDVRPTPRPIFDTPEHCHALRSLAAAAIPPHTPTQMMRHSFDSQARVTR